ncbi:Uncharacterised protein [Mycobacterium tuberculosis]|nr:Uncharacterised protein [Mycobacterium tuberculosis]
MRKATGAGSLITRGWALAASHRMDCTCATSLS